MTGFQEIRLADWDAIYQFQKARSAGGKNWIYRGQCDASWGLETSLEYAARTLAVDRNELPYREAGLIRRFKRLYHHHSTDSPADEDYLEWLSIMQHHGAPTRLLDWTYSFYPALFFAIEFGENDGALWAIDHDALVETYRSNPLLSEIQAITESVRNEYNFVNWTKTFARQPPVRFAVPANPYRLNPRLSIQQGLFLCPGDITSTFEANLFAVLGATPSVDVAVKAIIPSTPALRKQILLQLHRMNMNAATLFPGLDGLARSMRGLLASPKEHLPPDSKFEAYFALK